MDYPYNLGSYGRKVTTASADAQRWFDRGLNWCFGYHHEEAVACFEKALAADPMLVKRLRRLRASRQKARAARRLGFEVT